VAVSGCDVVSRRGLDGEKICKLVRAVRSPHIHLQRKTKRKLMVRRMIMSLEKRNKELGIHEANGTHDIYCRC
jgi:hypothetical protein